MILPKGTLSVASGRKDDLDSIIGDDGRINQSMDLISYFHLPRRSRNNLGSLSPIVTVQTSMSRVSSKYSPTWTPAATFSA
jgi:hypothetical protein